MVEHSSEQLSLHLIIIMVSFTNICTCRGFAVEYFFNWKGYCNYNVNTSNGGGAIY